MKYLCISKGVILIEGQDKKRRIDYDIEEILAEFADQKDGMASLAEKYKTPIGDLPSVDSKKTLSKRTDLPKGQRIVYEDKSLVNEQDSFFGRKQKKESEVLPEGVRVVFDADAQAQSEGDPSGDFASFDDIPYEIPESRARNKKERKTPYKDKVAPSKAVELPLSPMDEDGFQSFDELPAEDFGDNEKKGAGRQSAFARFFSNFIPQRGDGGSEVLRKLVYTASIIGFIVAFAMIIKNLTDTRTEVPPPIDETFTDTEGNYIDPRDSYPDIDFPEGLHDRFVHYYAINDDFVGQIVIRTNNRTIEEPVVQEKERPRGAVDYYLYRNFFREDSKYGTPYMDHRNDPDANDTNTIIHGHNMMDGAQFAIIEDYVYEKDGLNNLKEYPTITYWNRYEEQTYLIYSVMITNGREKDDNGYVFAYHTPKFMNEEAFLGYKRMLDMRNLYKTGIDLNFDDKLITISTCGYTFTDAWYVLVARKLRDDETEFMYTSNYERRSDDEIWYPQTWYKTKGKTNPFVDESKWYEY